MSARMHRTAQAFRSRLRSELKGAADVSFEAVAMQPSGLAVMLTGLAPWRYSAGALAGTLGGPGSRMFSDAGEKLWADITALGISITGERLTFALIHHPDALAKAIAAQRAEAA